MLARRCDQAFLEVLDKARQVRTWPVTAGTFSRCNLTGRGKGAYVDPCQKQSSTQTMSKHQDSWLCGFTIQYTSTTITAAPATYGRFDLNEHRLDACIEPLRRRPPYASNTFRQRQRFITVDSISFSKF